MLNCYTVFTITLLLQFHLLKTTAFTRTTARLAQCCHLQQRWNDWSHPWNERTWQVDSAYTALAIDCLSTADTNSSAFIDYCVTSTIYQTYCRRLIHHIKMTRYPLLVTGSSLLLTYKLLDDRLATRKFSQVDILLHHFIWYDNHTQLWTIYTHNNAHKCVHITHTDTHTHTHRHTCQMCSFSAIAATQYLPSGLTVIAVTLPAQTICDWVWS